MEQILAYFRSENDAESALTSLKKLKIEKERIEGIPEDSKKDRVIPFSSGGFQANVAEFGESFNEAAGEKGEQVTHLLQVDVAENDYEEAVRVLKDHGAMSKES